jgi:hypothetical protein
MVRDRPGRTLQFALRRFAEEALHEVEQELVDTKCFRSQTDSAIF